MMLESLYVNATQIRNKWIAERAVRGVKEGRLLCCCNQVWTIAWRNIQDLLSDGKTPYERLVGMP